MRLSEGHFPFFPSQVGEFFILPPDQLLKHIFQLGEWRADSSIFHQNAMNAMMIARLHTLPTKPCAKCAGSSRSCEGKLPATGSTGSKGSIFVGDGVRDMNTFWYEHRLVFWYEHNEHISISQPKWGKTDWTWLINVNYSILMMCPTTDGLFREGILLHSAFLQTLHSRPKVTSRLSKESPNWVSHGKLWMWNSGKAWGEITLEGGGGLVLLPQTIFWASYICLPWLKSLIYGVDGLPENRSSFALEVAPLVDSWNSLILHIWDQWTSESPWIPCEFWCNSKLPGFWMVLSHTSNSRFQVDSSCGLWWGQRGLETAISQLTQTIEISDEITGQPHDLENLIVQEFPGSICRFSWIWAVSFSHFCSGSYVLFRTGFIRNLPCFFCSAFFLCKLKVCGSWFRASTLCGRRRGWANWALFFWIWLDLGEDRWSAGWNHHLHQVLQDQAQQWVWWLQGAVKMGTWSTSHLNLSESFRSCQTVHKFAISPWLFGERGHPLIFLKWRQFWRDILCTVYLPWPSTSSISEQRNRRDPADRGTEMVSAGGLHFRRGGSVDWRRFSGPGGWRAAV